MKYIKKFTNWYITRHPRPMVSWWKTHESVIAKLTTSKEGYYILKIPGVKHHMIGYPRGYIVYGILSPLKHLIKWEMFNDSWAKLENGVSEEEVISEMKNETLGSILAFAERLKFEILPVNKMAPSVAEIHRAWTEVARGHHREKELLAFRDVVCFILQEDDAYRFRFQWLVQWFPLFLFKKSPVKYFDKALGMLEHGEIVGDMKERQRLFRKIIMLLLSDEGVRDLFEKFTKEADWRKIKLSKGDKFHFRAKYFKCDIKWFDY